MNWIKLISATILTLFVIVNEVSVQQHNLFARGVLGTKLFGFFFWGKRKNEKIGTINRKENLE